jgi:pimeloyl-ACP methyl ester carboxylesterase
MTEVNSGYAPVNGVRMYWQSWGNGGTPLILAPGGYGLTSTFAPLLDQLAQRRQVIAIELQGHGHTRDIDRSFAFSAFGDDIAALIRHLDLGRADLLGYSLGGGASLRATIQHPDLVRRLALVCTPFRRDGWFPAVREAMKSNHSSNFDQFRQSPMYADWLRVAPDKEAFPTLMDKTGALLAQPYDWTEEVRAISTPTMLVYADADSIGVGHMAEFFTLLGGGQADGNFDGSAPTEMRMAVLPGRTHYNILEAPGLGAMLAEFFG